MSHPLHGPLLPAAAQGDGGPWSIAVGQASEADTAQPIVASKSGAVGQASETDTAQPVTAQKSAAVELASETDAALSITASKALAVEQAAETDLALSITVVQGGGEQDIAVGQAIEADTAQPITAQKSAAVGQASETDTALPITATKALAVGQASEEDSAFSITAVGGAAAVTVQLISVREKPSLRLHIDAETPSGKHYRWGEDEPNPENVPGDLRFSSTMPGGFETLDVTLPRKPGVSYSDLERLSTLRSIGPGGEVAGEYRLERAPKVSGDKMAVSPSAVGHQAHLEDDKSAREIYVDRDLSHFQGMSRERQINKIVAGWFPQESAGVEHDTTVGLPAVKVGIQGAWAAWPLTEAWYDAGALRVARIEGTPQSNGIPSTGDALWNLHFGLRSNEAAADVWDSVSADQWAGGLNAQQAVSYAAGSRYAMISWYYNSASPAGGDGADYAVFWKSLAVYGTHGLTRQGTDPGGLYASDVIEHAVGTWAPLLSFSDDTIQPSGFIIPHLAFLDPTTAAEIIRQANRFHLFDWAVWEDKTFYYHQRGARGRKWRARISPAQLEETGPQMDRLWESVLVSFQDVDGTTKTVGPPGSGADTESALLKDSDPENPANQLGITRRDLLAMGTSTAAAAAEVGARFLAEQKLLDTSGRAQLVGHVEDDRGVLHPAWKVRAGDTIVFVDASDPRERRIVKADYSHDTRTCSVDLDAPPEGLQSLLERLGVVLIPLSLS